MSGMNSDQLHRSTLGIYSSLMDDFNPSLQKLVSLGNSYAKAFNTLALASEAYFSALSNIGEKAFLTASSNSIGETLIQICESQRRLTMDLEGVFRWFTSEFLQEMDRNTRLDKDYILSSREQYEVEVHKQTTALERQLRRGSKQDCSEYVQFLRQSHGEALQEEERRYRFVAEKHCGLLQSVTRLMMKTGEPLQQSTDAWIERISATRRVETRRPFVLENSMGLKTEVRQSREEQPLGSVPSRAPSPQGSIRSRTSSVGDGGGGRTMRARVAHQPAGSNPTLLTFTGGQIITVLVQQPRNGWLYGRAENSSRQGWFPASYVEALDNTSESLIYSGSSLQSSSSMSSLIDQPQINSLGRAQVPPPPPPLSNSSASKKHSETQPHNREMKKKPESKSKSEIKASQTHGSRPELFPRGTNPFATVKLKPTTTNDRSAPRLHRR